MQQSDVDSSLVNVIIKPIESLKINFTNVQYYIYRGILKSSLINGSNIATQASSNNEFVSQIWQNHSNYKAQFNKPNEPDPLPEVFGYDNSLAKALEIEKIYDNSQGSTRPTFVKQGMWFGDFAATHKIGFEIITESNRVTLDLAYLRKEKYLINTSSLSGFSKQAAKEEILAFIDPAAFFGLHL